MFSYMTENKSRILYILRILNEMSDENHTMTIAEIIDCLTKFEISTCRKTVVSDIKLLQEFGVDVICIKSSQNRYFIGERDFEIPELKLLIDSVEASKFIPLSKSNSLIKKLSNYTSIYQAALLNKHIYVDDRVKQLDQRIYYTVDILSSALDRNRQVTFQYYEYDPNKVKVPKHDGYRYILRPYALTYNNDYYYVMGYSEKHNKVTEFRVDRILSAEILQEVCVPIPNDFNVAIYCKQVFSMFDEKLCMVELKCENKVMKHIIDKFGECVETKTLDKDYFMVSTEVSVSPTFLAWVFQFCGEIEIISPKFAKTQMREMIDKM